MKALFSSALVLCLALMMTACSGKDSDVKEFVLKLSSCMVHEQMDSLRAMYPGVPDGLEFNVPALLSDTIEIENQDGDLVNVKLPNVSLVLQIDGAGGYIVKESRGLLTFGADRLRIARGTGWVTDDLSDLAIAERFQDTEFEAWLPKKFVEEVRSRVKVGVTRKDSYNGYIFDVWDVATVTNDNDFPLPAGSYSVSFLGGTRSGGEIAPHSSVTITQSLNGGLGYPYANLNLNESALQPLFEQHFQPTGGEYQEYLQSKQ